ncbi:MAG: VCBS repeat-containing protein [Verrucomicrobiales bacterium]|nr:VCBS repeat-containing protein [Verrucomicrobiales bacterium]
MSSRYSVLRPRAATLAALTFLGGSLHGIEPAFISVKPFVDEFGSGGLVDLTVSAPVHSQVTLQFKSEVGGDDWKDYSAPTLVSSEKPITFSVPTSFSDGTTPVPHRFFRFRVETFGIDVEDDGAGVRIASGSEVPANLLFQTISAKTGQAIFGTNESSHVNLLAPFKANGATLEDAFSNAGLHLWTLGPARDDLAFAKRLALPIARQVKGLPDPVGDVGEGKIDEGFKGLPGLEEPILSRRDLPPSPNNDKGLKIEIEESREVLQQANPRLIEAGRHLRFSFQLALDGGLKGTAAYSLRGSPLPSKEILTEDSLPKNPPLGALVYVVRSPKQAANQEGGIYFIGAESDPFQARVYQPPFRGSHSHVDLAEESVRLSIPILDRDQDLEGLQVEIYRYVRPAAIGVLTPEVFTKLQRNFKLLGSVSGSELNKLVASSTRGVPALQDVELAGVTRAATLTQLHNSGSRAKKFNMVIIGEGFADTAADQAAFDNYIRDVVMKDLLERDVHPEILNAINIFRINTYSKQSGVTQVNANGQVTTSKDTALGYRFSGDWNRCWMEPGPGTVAAIDSIVNTLIPEADVKAIVLNTPSFGGCSRGHHFAVTRGVDWSVFAHEFGHFFGKLGDEYQCNQGAAGCGSYSGAEPEAKNLTKVTSRSLIEWNDWIPASRPVPTGLANVADQTQDVGLFPGATMGSGQWWNGIYRPSWRGRMNNNSPTHNPVGYTAMRDNARARQDGDFRKSVSGDFNGDGRTDLVILDDRQLSLYLAQDRDTGANDPVTGAPLRAVTGVLEPAWYHTDILFNVLRNKSWEFRGSDVIIPADFDHDGLTDLYVINLVAWNQGYVVMLKSTGKGFVPVRRFDGVLPGWGELRAGDQFYAGDFNGDGRSDLMVFNGQDWSMPYFLMLRSTGDNLAYVHRYDRFLPGWEMGRHEKFQVGDFDGDRRQDLISQNTQDWNQVHLMVFRSVSTALALTDRYYGEIRIDNRLYWTMRRQDELFLPNFNGDKTSDLVVFNGRDWSPEYLGLFAMVEGKLRFRQRYDGSVPGWDMRRRDRFYVSDVNGDGLQDLVVYNGENWSTQYLGVLRSAGDGTLTGTWQADWIGSWNLGAGDDFHVADFRGAAGWDDLFVFNKNWFGMLRSYSNRFQLEAIYPKWIHNHRYHAYGWW